MDEFVTVDEVIEEVNPFQAKQAPPKGKRKEALKNTPSSELNLKKKRGKTSAPRVVEGELSFVTLDEIGEEEDAATHLAQALVTVDEVIDEEEINMEEMVKNSNSLLTLDELIDQDDCISHSEPKDVTVLSVAEEQDLLKQERLVTVDEIGEVEELPLNESTDISFATLNTKGDEGNTGRDSIGFISSQMPEDPSTLVTVDEIQDDSSDLHLVTLDEVTEEDEDSLADFNNLKEELNFVTVDEVGEEEDGDNDLKVELAQSKNDHPTDKRGDRKKRAVDTKKTKLEALSQVGLVNETVLEEDLKTMIERHLAGRYLKVVFFLFYGGITFKISKICVVALLVISPYVDIRSQQIVMVSDNFQRNMYKLDRFLLVTEQALPQVVIPQEKMTKSEIRVPK